MTKLWLNQHIKSALNFPGLSLADLKQYKKIFPLKNTSSTFPDILCCPIFFFINYKIQMLYFWLKNVIRCIVLYIYN